MQGATVRRLERADVVRLSCPGWHVTGAVLERLAATQKGFLGDDMCYIMPKGATSYWSLHHMQYLQNFAFLESAKAPSHTSLKKLSASCGRFS